MSKRKAAITDSENRKAAQLQSQATTLAQMPDDVLGKIWGYKHAHETIKKKVKEKHAFERDMRLWNAIMDAPNRDWPMDKSNREALHWHNWREWWRGTPPWNTTRHGDVTYHPGPRGTPWGLIRFLE